jgi:hypothetical protein
MGFAWVFTYWEAGDKVTRASSIPTKKVVGGLGKLLGEWRPTNELNKACFFWGGGTYWGHFGRAFSFMLLLRRAMGVGVILCFMGKDRASRAGRGNNAR